VLRLVRDALTADEHTLALAPALREAQSKAVRLLTQATPPPVPELIDSQKKTVSRGQKKGLTLAEAADQLEQLKKEQEAGRAVTVSLAWLIESGGEQT
jgi:hypothetical protein